MIYFSKSANGFFVGGINEDMPEDIVEVSEDMYASLMSGQQTEGKVITSDADGYPVLSIPEVDHAEAAERQRAVLIAEANSYINERQWPSKLALGRLGESDKAEFNRWLDYLDQLEALSLSDAPDITWPDKPE
ncbi:tail fiber assembly protein [Cronobacter sakazakii]|nr:tail fiber assembly protein [Cronobacter sakazakii]ELY3451694.1 tail fiber assembly protein [Cronobacter sakazakii]ELY4084130.1 tail fiber assembly protein [Cronobacter sakazakii]ELY4360539.1 tail fiber assembly protein [Cronobacter sakazakii]ELY4552408.1 tail fiber assembly protein [Cronobacter sakazakii]